MTTLEISPRPFSAIFLMIYALGIVLWNGLRLYLVIYYWVPLQEDLAKPLYITVFAVIWMLLAMVYIVGILKRKSWVWYAGLAGAAGFGTWYWFDRLIMQMPRPDWPFALGTTCLLEIIIIFLIVDIKKSSSFSK
jgi:hypothetical protein